MAAPYCTFFGPDGNGTLYLQDFYGTRKPIFMVTGINKKTKPHVRIFRVMPNAQQVPFSSASISNGTGSIVVNWNSQDIKLQESIIGTKQFKTPTGVSLTWKPTGWLGNTEELWDDKSKTKMAEYNLKPDDGIPRLDIFVRADDEFIDMLLAISLALYRSREKLTNETKTAFKVVTGLLKI